MSTFIDISKSISNYIEKQRRIVRTEEACQSGYHRHALGSTKSGKATCHPIDRRHQQDAIKAMGGKKAYESLHPQFRSTEKESGDKKEKKEESGKTLSDKWFDNSKTEALLSQKFKSIEDRKRALLNTIPEKWHDTVEFNDDVLTQPDDRIFSTTAKWLFKYNTTNPKTGKASQHVVYSKNHLDQSELKKWEQLKTVNRDIGRIRKYADTLLDHNNSEFKAIGAAIHLIDVTGFRIGGEKYAEENGTYGITSLKKGHVKVLANNRVELNFIGKAGVIVEKRRFTVPPKLHDYLGKQIKGRRAQDLLSINDGHVRRSLEPFNIRPKDLRSYKSNMLLINALSSGPQYKGDLKKREAHVKKITTEVAGEVGHTRGVALRSYWHPTIIQSYLDGKGLTSLEAIFKQEDVIESNYYEYISAEEKRFKEYFDTVHIV